MLARNGCLIDVLLLDLPCKAENHLFHQRDLMVHDKEGTIFLEKLIKKKFSKTIATFPLLTISLPAEASKQNAILNIYRSGCR